MKAVTFFNEYEWVIIIILTDRKYPSCNSLVFSISLPIFPNPHPLLSDFSGSVVL